MKLEEAMYIVINEAETSALGECSSKGNEVLEAVELLHNFYEQYGHQFSNFSVDIDGEVCHS